MSEPKNSQAEIRFKKLYLSALVILIITLAAVLYIDPTQKETAQLQLAPKTSSPLSEQPKTSHKAQPDTLPKLKAEKTTYTKTKSTPIDTSTKIEKKPAKDTITPKFEDTAKTVTVKTKHKTDDMRLKPSNPKLPKKKSAETKLAKPPTHTKTPTTSLTHSIPKPSSKKVISKSKSITPKKTRKQPPQRHTSHKRQVQKKHRQQRRKKMHLKNSLKRSLGIKKHPQKLE